MTKDESNAMMEVLDATKKLNLVENDKNNEFVNDRLKP
jgi:hypothetical protein